MVRHTPALHLHVMVNLSHRNMLKVPPQRSNIHWFLYSIKTLLLEWFPVFSLFSWSNKPLLLLSLPVVLITFAHQSVRPLCNSMPIVVPTTAASLDFQGAMLKRCKHCFGGSSFLLLEDLHIHIMCFVKTGPLFTPFKAFPISSPPSPLNFIKLLMHT